MFNLKYTILSNMLQKRKQLVHWIFKLSAGLQSAFRVEQSKNLLQIKLLDKTFNSHLVLDNKNCSISIKILPNEYFIFKTIFI